MPRKQDKILELIEAALLEAPIKTELTPRTAAEVEKHWGKEKLEYEPAEKKFIPDKQIKLSTTDKIAVLSELFKINMDRVIGKVNMIEASPDLKDKQLVEWLNDCRLEGVPEIDFVNLSLSMMVALYSPSFMRLDANKSKTESKPVKYSNQKVNFNKWLQSYGMVVGKQITNPLEKVGAEVMSFFSDMVPKGQFDVDLFSNAPIYLEITGKAEKTLLMSISKFYNSCQNLYGKGAYGTTHMKSLLSNVFDENVKVAYFTLLGTPYTDPEGATHPDTVLARVLIRHIGEEGSKKIYVERNYPQESNFKALFMEMLKKYFPEYEFIGEASKAGPYNIQYTKQPNQEHGYSDIPMPYMDTLKGNVVDPVMAAKIEALHNGELSQPEVNKFAKDNPSYIGQVPVGNLTDECVIGALNTDADCIEFLMTRPEADMKQSQLLQILRDFNDTMEAFPVAKGEKYVKILTDKYNAFSTNKGIENALIKIHEHESNGKLGFFA